MPLEDVNVDLYVHPVSGLLLKNGAYAMKLHAYRKDRRRQAAAESAERRILDAKHISCTESTASGTWWMSRRCPRNAT